MHDINTPDLAERAAGSGWLRRLSRDRTANTMALMAMAIIPLAGLVGGALDVSRLYIVKTRLQHACDAGALAGRKAMGGGQWSQNGYTPRATAARFFLANFAPDSYGSIDSTSGFTENAGKVSGTASAIVPMTLMRILGFTQQTINVQCEAEMRLPNTDVMFVLDNTGSMSSKAVATDTQTKMEALRSAVKCFYEIVQKLDTDEVCVGGAPSGGLSDQVQVRFGFVPYDMNVNVGRLLPQSYLADRWTYQSRTIADQPVFGVFNRWYDNSTVSGPLATGYGAYTTSDTKTVGSGTCDSSTFPTPSDEWTPTADQRLWPVNGSETETDWRAYTPAVLRNYNTTTSGSGSNRKCILRYRERVYYRMAVHDRATPSTPGAVAFPVFVYKPVELNISGLKSSSNMANVTLPIVSFNSMTTATGTITNGNGQWNSNAVVAWPGCIEERQTVRATSYDPIPSDAFDLDLKSAPTSNVATQWAPVLPNAVFGRKDATNTYTRQEITTFNSGTFGRSSSCPVAAHKMEQWPDANTFDAYVDSLAPGGNTYHDIGLIWGARLMWPTGIFRSENEFTPKGGEIQRHLIFMTDGDACTDIDNYQAYGFAAIDRRQTDINVLPTEGCTTSGTLTQQVNARYQAVCKAVRNENITLWVIWFGAKNNTIEKMMTDCATPGRYFAARNSADLQNTFRQIADQISQLRITN